MSVNYVLDVKNLTVGYRNHVAVDDISFNVEKGDLLGIVGPNGAGKTTLFRAILGLQQYRTGKIKLFGYGSGEYSPLISMIGYVPQKIAFDKNFPATVFDVVSMGMISKHKIAKCAKMVKKSGFDWTRIYNMIDRDDDKIYEALKTVGMESLRDRRIGDLSGGELQRIFIAKSLVKDPLLLILDEPVTSVDMESQNKFYNVITKINKENKVTIVWSSHDLDALEKYATKVACMNCKLFFHDEKEKLMLVMSKL